MRRPFLRTHAVDGEMDRNSRNPAPEKLSDLGPFTVVSGPVLVVLGYPEWSPADRDP